jgi:outer membrane usher protein
MSGSLTLGYSNETYLSTLYVDRSNRPEFRIATRISFRPDDKTTVAAGYDSLNRQADLSAYRSEGTGVGRWDVSVNVQQHDLDGRSAIGGAASYAGNRAEVRVAHSGTTYDPLAGTLVDQRSSLRVGSAIAFADGRVAVGAPIRGNGFAIVYPHESIASKEITVGSGQDVRARSDSWGPAVVTNLPAYQPSTIPIDVADLPVGYSLGAATFDIVAPYKAGYSLEVGSAYSVYAYGTLLLPDGAPVALLTGVARPASGPGRQVSVFTNAAGKFGAEGLAPGRWTIEMATAPQPTRYVIDIPQGTDGLFRCGTLRPMS